MNKSFVVIVITSRGIIEYEKGFRHYKNSEKYYNERLEYYKNLESKSNGENETTIEVSLCEYIQNGLKLELNKIIKKQQYFLGADVYQEDR